jgi:hypothetical protein
MKTEKIAKEKGIEDLFFADLEIHAIRFAKWLEEKSYNDMFQDVKNDGETWASYADESKRFTIKDLYKQFMIDDLCL